MKQLILNNKEFSFEYSKDYNLWKGVIIFHNYNISIEIINENDIETLKNEIESFYNFAKNDFIKNLIKQSQSILLSFINIVPFGESNVNYQYFFKLDSIIYKGLKQGLIFENQTFRFELLFKLYNEKYIECDDPFGNYLVDIDNGLILGLRREQV